VNKQFSDINFMFFCCPKPIPARQSSIPVIICRSAENEKTNSSLENLRGIVRQASLKASKFSRYSKISKSGRSGQFFKDFSL
jgi:hypothetical protein